jgi:hypothetical protein
MKSPFSSISLKMWLENVNRKRGSTFGLKACWRLIPYGNKPSIFVAQPKVDGAKPKNQFL